MRGWKDLGSDVSWEEHGGLWGRKSAVDHSWYILEWTNMYDACGERECKLDGQAQYCCQVTRVVLSDLSKGQIKNALNASSLDLNDLDIKHQEVATVEVCARFGFKQPLADFSSDTYPIRLRAKARKFAEELMQNKQLLKDLLRRPVNKIGSTAEEYGRGDFDSALHRGPFDLTKQIIRKMHGF